MELVYTKVNKHFSKNAERRSEKRRRTMTNLNEMEKCDEIKGRAHRCSQTEREVF